MILNLILKIIVHGEWEVPIRLCSPALNPEWHCQSKLLKDVMDSKIRAGGVEFSH
jgi:hypothetical protein